MPSSNQTWDDVSLAPSTRYIAIFLRTIFTNERVWDITIITPIAISIGYRKVTNSALVESIRAFTVRCLNGKVELESYAHYHSVDGMILQAGGLNVHDCFLLSDPQLEEKIRDWFMAINYSQHANLPEMRDVRVKKCRQ